MKTNNVVQALLLVLVVVTMIVGYHIGKNNGYKEAVKEVCYLADYQTDFCQTFLSDFVLPGAEQGHQEVLIQEQELGAEVKEQVDSKTDNLGFILELRNDCNREYDDAVQTIETWARSDLQGGQLFGRKSGVLDENNFVREKEDWLKECTDKKASSWQE